MTEGLTRQEQILNLLRQGVWVSTVSLANASVGGSEGMRRLRELRGRVQNGEVKGYRDIEKRRKPRSAQWEYRLVPKTDGRLF